MNIEKGWQEDSQPTDKENSGQQARKQNKGADLESRNAASTTAKS